MYVNRKKYSSTKNIVKRAIARARTQKVAARSGGFIYNQRGQIMRPNGSTEQKFIDYVIASSALFPFGAITGASTLLNGIPQGTDAVTRIGRKFRMKYISFRGNTAAALTTAGFPSSFRLILVLDKQINGAASLPTGAAVLNVDRQTGLPNMDNRERFKILKEWRWMLAPNIVSATTTWSVPTNKYVKGFYKFKPSEAEVVCNLNNNNTVAGINTGALFFLSYTDGFLATASPVGNFDVRLRFEDI